MEIKQLSGGREQIMYTETSLVRVARRENNNKRKYLVVNRLQGKHIPVKPCEALAMFRALADVVKGRFGREKLLVIGFAETATAVGAAVAAELGADSMQTTREQISGVSYLYFSEEHSHATEQKLVKDDIDRVIDAVERIVFVEDEVTTGRTILNIINILKKRYPQKIKFSVVSILNGMDQTALDTYRGQDIALFWLVKTDHAAYTVIAETYRGDGSYIVCKRDIAPENAIPVHDLPQNDTRVMCRADKNEMKNDTNVINKLEYRTAYYDMGVIDDSEGNTEKSDTSVIFESGDNAEEYGVNVMEQPGEDKTENDIGVMRNTGQCAAEEGTGAAGKSARNKDKNDIDVTNRTEKMVSPEGVPEESTAEPASTSCPMTYSAARSVSITESSSITESVSITESSSMTESVSITENRSHTEAVCCAEHRCPVEHIKIKKHMDARRIVNSAEYAAYCGSLYQELVSQVDFGGVQNMLVLGTEEYMYPALYAASRFEAQGKDVRFHATTRSPIAVSAETDYPLHTRYELNSLYDGGRTTYIYDLQKYDTVVIFTDAEGDIREGICSLIRALQLCGNDRIILVH